jgi:aspartate 1-decarboxylase
MIGINDKILKGVVIMELNKYCVKIKHDNGIFCLNVAATCEESAKIIICKSEVCPESAIIDIKKVIN